MTLDVSGLRSDVDVTSLARRVAASSSDGQICIRVSEGAPVQVSCRGSLGVIHESYGATLDEALHAAVIRAESVSAAHDARSRLPGIRGPLPGTPLGAHDSVVLRGRESEPLAARIVWVHHAVRDGNGKVRGERCEEEGINAHAVLVDDLDRLSLVPGVTCSTCGRTGWITEGQFIPSVAHGDMLGDRRSGDDRRSSVSRRSST